MQLKLKENPQTPSVFQRKDLKTKPLKYLLSHFSHIVELTEEN